MMENWKDGDVFRWRYKKPETRFGEPYWCKACRAIVHQGRLKDIFWSYIDQREFKPDNSHGANWDQAEAEKELNLEYLGNLNDYDPIHGSKEPLYEPADIIDLRHSNSSHKHIYSRKGAKLSQRAMMIFCCMPPEKFKRLESASRSRPSSSRAISLSILSLRRA